MKRIVHSLAVCTCGATLLFTPATARSATLATESFDYPSSTSIFNLNGGSGWTSAWGYLSSREGTITAPGLNYGLLAAAGNALSTPAVAPTTEPGVFVRNLPDFGLDGTTLFMSVLVRPDAGFGVYGGVNFGGLFIGKSGAPGADNYGLEGPLNSISSSATPALANVTTLLVVRADYRPGADHFELFVNPPVDALPPTPSAVKDDLDAGVTGYFLVNNAGGFTTDEIRIGTTFRDVVPIPEPTAASLLALGALSLFALRRPRH